jgi:predicted transcriptional regulator of viral defense system
MKFNEFKRKIKQLPVFSSSDAVRLSVNRQAMRNQLNRWRTRGLIIELKRGFYAFSPDEQASTVSPWYVAGRLYSPSYVSLETALGFYGLIPERVTTVTSISTKKTKKFINPLGAFIYQHLKPSCFRGFKAREEEGLSYFIAEPEKAVVDFLYLNLDKFKKQPIETLVDSYRFQNVDSLKSGKIRMFCRLFANKSLTDVCDKLCNLIKQEQR